jgi:hypothetical protein
VYAPAVGVQVRGQRLLLLRQRGVPRGGRVLSALCGRRRRELLLLVVLLRCRRRGFTV